MTQRYNSQDDPLGLGLKERARQHHANYDAEQYAANPFYGLFKPINNLVADIRF